MYRKRPIRKPFTRLSGVTIVLAIVLTGMAADAGAEVTYTFTSITEEIMDTRVTSFVNLEDEPFHITNNTPFPWDGFRLSLEGRRELGEYEYMQFADIGQNEVIYNGPGTAGFLNENGDELGYNEVMVVEGLNIPDGGEFSFTVDILGGVPQGLVGFDIVGQPAAIPEPSTIAMLAGVGLMGLLALARRRRRQET